MARRLNGGQTMVRKTLGLACLALCVAISAPLGAASGDDTLVKFDGGIGVIPISNVVQAVALGPVTVNRNIVRGVNSPGQIWVIRALRAEVEADGHITVRGRGLLLGGGNGIGTNANQSVRATLSCAAAGPFFSTDLVPLDAAGDFRIDDLLESDAGLNTSPATFPTTCDSPVLLIRNAGGAWFAAGIVDLDDN
jgi:hypothetical protein